MGGFLPSELSESVKSLLDALAVIGPASNRLVQFLFRLPMRAVVMFREYPEFAENDDLRIILGLRYTPEGLVDAEYPSYLGHGLGYHLRGIFLALFRYLSNSSKRSIILKIADITEDKFREYDPLRIWLDIAIDHASKVRPEALKLLSLIVKMLRGREYISVTSDEWRSFTKDVKDVDECIRFLYEYVLLLPPKVYGYIHVDECPLLLDVYADLRGKLPF